MMDEMEFSMKLQFFRTKIAFDKVIMANMSLVTVLDVIFEKLHSSKTIYYVSNTKRRIHFFV